MDIGGRILGGVAQPLGESLAPAAPDERDEEEQRAQRREHASVPPARPPPTPRPAIQPTRASEHQHAQDGRNDLQRRRHGERHVRHTAFPTGLRVVPGDEQQARGRRVDDGVAALEGEHHRRGDEARGKRKQALAPVRQRQERGRPQQRAQAREPGARLERKRLHEQRAQRRVAGVAPGLPVVRVAPFRADARHAEIAEAVPPLLEERACGGALRTRRQLHAPQRARREQGGHQRAAGRFLNPPEPHARRIASFHGFASRARASASSSTRRADVPSR